MLAAVRILRYLCSMPQRTKSISIIPTDRIERAILLIRGQKVMLDRDLAELYGVDPRALRQQVKRNPYRFPSDFFFQLSQTETEMLVSQIVTPSRRSFGGSLPYAFTQEGVAMLSSVLHSERAVHVNIAIMRAFVRLREVLASHKDLAVKLEELEKKFESHDETITQIFDAIKALMSPPAEENERRIGFRLEP